MNKSALLFLCLLLICLGACSVSPAPEVTIPETNPIITVTSEPTAEPACPPETATAPTPPPEPVVELTDEEKSMLLKLGMAERGSTGCTECIALVMRTVLNRVASDRFGSSISKVILAQDQFTPVADGSYYRAEPNERCQEALDMVIYGWDESQGALFYEWCEGESWHSKNLHLLFQHCDTRFYN